jgi:hypothetical protein
LHNPSDDAVKIVPALDLIRHRLGWRLTAEVCEKGGAVHMFHWA